jgi:pantoate--beta-alanine ligase
MPVNSCQSRGFVPTMGALHEGHLSLIRQSKSENSETIVSVFVNPTQFAPTDDLSRYPRPFERDCELAQQAGADLIFAPNKNEMYTGATTEILVTGVSDYFEGSHRPGHFNGVATVVSKLFNIVNPQKAYFGQKDLQQCAVINTMVKDLNFRIDLVIGETVREHDGLAMSSRNTYLSADERELAPKIYAELKNCQKLLIQNKLVETCLSMSHKLLTESGFVVDYFNLIDRNSMKETNSVNSDSALIVAAKLGKTRLIDNVLFG